MVLNLKELFKIDEDNRYNEKVINGLLSAIKENQIEEFDYLRFKLSLKNLMNLGMDYPTAAKSALLTAKTMGLTKEKLLQTTHHYKNVINKERDKFVIALKNQIANNVDSKSIEINNFKSKIEENKRKIEQLLKEQEQLDQLIELKNAELDAAKVKIEEVKIQFNETFDALYNQIEEDSTFFNNIL